MNAAFAAMARHHAYTAYVTAGSIFATIGLSSIPGWIAIITAAGSFFGLAALRSTATLWRGERNAERAKAERLDGDLKAEQHEHERTKIMLKAAEDRPDIAKLYDLMLAHDGRMVSTSKEIATALQEVSSNLAANTAALQLWATEQARKF